MLLGTVTAVGGGVIRDVLSAEILAAIRWELKLPVFEMVLARRERDAHVGSHV